MKLRQCVQHLNIPENPGENFSFPIVVCLCFNAGLHLVNNNKNLSIEPKLSSWNCNKQILSNEHFI